MLSARKGSTEGVSSPQGPLSHSWPGPCEGHVAALCHLDYLPLPLPSFSQHFRSASSATLQEGYPCVAIAHIQPYLALLGHVI